MPYTLQPWQVFLTALAGWINRHQQAAIDFLREENRVLLEQLGDRRIRLTDDQRRRLAVAGKAVGRKALADFAGLVTPDTILALHRKLVAAKWNQRSRRGPGRPDPAPERGSRTSWRTFLGAVWSTIAAIDFTTVEMWGRHGLVTMYVLFAIELRSRRVDFAGMTPGPDDAWIRQIGRNFTDPVDGFLREKRFCLIDRDAKFTAAFRRILAGAGIEPVRLPPRSPNLNAWIERFMRSIKSECLDRMIFFGEDSLRRAVREYLVHYHAERNHQGLGGMLRYYHREAA